MQHLGAPCLEQLPWVLTSLSAPRDAATTAIAAATAEWASPAMIPIFAEAVSANAKAIIAIRERRDGDAGCTLDAVHCSVKELLYLLPGYVNAAPNGVPPQSRGLAAVSAQRAACRNRLAQERLASASAAAAAIDVDVDMGGGSMAGLFSPARGGSKRSANGEPVGASSPLSAGASGAASLDDVAQIEAFLQEEDEWDL